MTDNPDLTYDETKRAGSYGSHGDKITGLYLPQVVHYLCPRIEMFGGI